MFEIFLLFDNFQHPSKGVNLKVEGVKVIKAFQGTVEAVVSSKEKKKLSSVRITRNDKSLLEQIFQQLELDESLNQFSKMNELLNWVKARLDHEPIISDSGSEIASLSSISQETQLLQGELKLQPITNDDQTETINLAISLPDEILDAATPQSNPTSSPFLTSLSAESSRPPYHSRSTAVSGTTLEAKIDKLVDVMTQFIDLQIQGTTQPPQIPLKKEKLKPITQSKPSTALRVSQENHQTGDNSAQRASRNSPEALSVINNAINAIIAHNNATDLHDFKWAISINAVKKLVSDVTKSQRLVDRAIALRQDEIDQHHTYHQIDANHNHRHKRKRTIKEAIPFSSARPN